MNGINMEFLDRLFPETGGRAFLDHYWLEKYTLQHGPVSRLPACLRPPDGAAAGVHLLHNWRPDDIFDVVVPNDPEIPQMTVRALPPSAFYRMGTAVRLTEIHRRIPELDSWVGGVCKELGVPKNVVHVNGWFANKSNGVKLHYDPGEVILIQLVGTKRMRIGANRFATLPDSQFNLAKPCTQRELPLFSGGFPEDEPDDLVEIELRPGSVLAMPRGTWHDSEAMDSESVAVALYIRTPTSADLVLDYMRDLLRHDAKWRRPVRGWQGEESDRQPAAAQLAEALQSLGQYTGDIEPEQVFCHAEPVEQRTRLPQAPYTLQRLPEARFSVDETSGDTCQVTIRACLNVNDSKTSQVELDRAMLPAMEWIAGRGARFTPGDVGEICTDLSSGDIEGLIEVLLATNYIALLPFSPRMS